MYPTQTCKNAHAMDTLMRTGEILTTRRIKITIKNKHQACRSRMLFGQKVAWLTLWESGPCGSEPFS